MEHAIAHQTDKSRYVLTVDGVEAGACHYVDAGTTREFNHTVTKVLSAAKDCRRR